MNRQVVGLTADLNSMPAQMVSLSQSNLATVATVDKGSGVRLRSCV